MPDPDYMHRQTEINEKMRAILVDWLIDVHRKFKLLPETLYLALNLMDRYMSLRPCARSKLQLVGVTAMLIASKYEEIYAPEVRDFVYVSAHAYPRDEILAMERSIIAALDFNLTVPTAYSFVRRYLEAGTADARQIKMSYFLLELAQQDFQMLRFPPSVQSAAAVCLARKYLGAATMWAPEMQHYALYTEAALRPCIHGLHENVRAAQASRFEALKKKYSLVENLEVAPVAFARASTIVDL